MKTSNGNVPLSPDENQMKINFNLYALYSVSHITRNLFLTGSSAVAEIPVLFFKECIVRGLNFTCGDF